MGESVEYFQISSLHKDDIIQAFEGCDNLDEVKKMVSKLKDLEMSYLAKKLGEDYCNQLFWQSLKIIFEDKFLCSEKAQ